MKHIDEYRDPESALRYARQIAGLVTQDWMIMEVCGGQTHAIIRNGIDRLLPEKISLLHGPGCPVCVTSVELIDQAIEIASLPEVIFCSFGDMLRVPGSHSDLLSVKAKGGDVRTIYSPLDSLKIALDNPSKQIVFFAIGFETTAPSNAATIIQAERTGITNFSALVAQVLIPPAIEALLKNPECNIDGLLAPGHVCTITGFAEYERLVSLYNVPIVVTGFEPLDILQGVHMALTQLEKGEARLENQYLRSAKPKGNIKAWQLIEEVFKPVDREWRGLGEIPDSGLDLKGKYIQFDARKRFDLNKQQTVVSSECISGLVLQGRKNPCDCPAFGSRCVPEHPLGATMVSSEGACAAYYHYRKR